MSATPLTFEAGAAWALAHCENLTRVIAGAPAAGRHWRSQYHLLHAFGRAMKPTPSPIGYGVPQHCFDNAHVAVEGDPRYLYAEGLCVMPRVPFPFHHAWVVDSVTGAAHEVTIRDAVPAAFFGVVFRREYSAEAFRAGTEVDCVCVLDAWPLRWPIFNLPPDQLRAVLADAPEVPNG